jgi:hypothetical protein
LQPTTHPNSPLLLNTSIQVSYTFVRDHNIHSCGFYNFLLVNLSFLVLTFKCEYFF